MPFDQQNFEVAPQATGDRVLDALVNARHLLSDRANWFGFGQGGGGDRRLCAALAVAHFAEPDIKFSAHTQLRRALPTGSTFGMGLEDVFHFNDTHPHAEVMSLFDRAIAHRTRSVRSRWLRYWRRA